MDKCIYHTTLHAHTRLWLSHNACMLQGESLRCKLRHKNTVESLKVILSRLLALKVSTLVPFIIIMIIMCPLNLSSQILEMSSQNSNCLDILSWHIKNLISTSDLVVSHLIRLIYTIIIGLVFKFRCFVWYTPQCGTIQSTHYQLPQACTKSWLFGAETQKKRF